MPRIDTQFEVAFANAMAKVESYNKHLYRPNSYLHKWWARRCGTTFRLILKHLVEDEAQHDFYAAGGLEGKVILDPMMGGGTTLHEAIRLGANVIGADLDPIPVLQARTTLSAVSTEQLTRTFNQIHKAARKKLSHHFTTTTPCCGKTTEFNYLLYGRRKRCACREVLAVDSYVLRYESDETAVLIHPTDGHIFRLKLAELEAWQKRPLPHTDRRLIEKRERHCPNCAKRYKPLTELPFYQRFEPIALVGQCKCEQNRPYKLFFKQPDESDLQKIADANALRPDFGETAAQFVVGRGPKSDILLAQGIDSYLELFSSRQLLVINEMLTQLRKVDGLHKLNLGLLLSTSLEFNAMLCGYKGGNIRRPGAIRHVFSHHAYSFPNTAVENNPLYPKRKSGTLLGLYHARILRGKKWAALPEERLLKDGKVAGKTVIFGENDFGEEITNQHALSGDSGKFLLIQGSSVSLPLETNSVDYIVTDPPYFDNVQYSDLSNFFRVWLKQIFHEDADWSLDIDRSAVDPRISSNGQYEQILGGIFRECHRVLKENGRFIFTFHHANPKGWAALTLALKRANFSLVNRYVIHAENAASVHIANMTALYHDALFILAPAEANAQTTFNLPNKIDTTTSETFMHGCATALGWMLNNRIEDAAVEGIWEGLVEKEMDSG